MRLYRVDFDSIPFVHNLVLTFVYFYTLLIVLIQVKLLSSHMFAIFFKVLLLSDDLFFF